MPCEDAVQPQAVWPQSGHCWYQKLSSIFISLGFQQCSVDQVIFHKSDKCKKELTVIVVPLVHVNDCTITATNAHLVEDFKASLCKHVEVTDLGALHWMLGIEIRWDRKASTIHLSQHAYINSILCHYHLADLKPLSTPMDTSTQLTVKQALVSTTEHTAM